MGAHSYCVALAVILLFVVLANAQQPKKVLYIPLDERFTTRNAFLNLGLVTPYTIITPPTQLICSLRKSAPLDLLSTWFVNQSVGVDYMVISAELFLYGGLIQSRISNSTTSQVLQQLQLIVNAKRNNPKLQVLLATVVMRIENANAAFEDAWYWAYWGQDIYGYSFYIDKYSVTGDPNDLKTANQFKAKIPSDILDDFLWRRSRNYNVTTTILQLQAQHQQQQNNIENNNNINNNVANQLFDAIYITLDDNAEYGLNIREAQELKDMVTKLGLQQTVKIYPGADEVGLTMLSKMATIDQQDSPVLQLIFRDYNTINYIPAYEGQPMIDTLKDQITAAGGTWSIINPGTPATPCPQLPTKKSILLFVNNFSTKNQVEAPDQPLNGTINDFIVFQSYLKDSNCIIGFADNRYCNGADMFFVDWIFDTKTNYNLNTNRFCYAGWNTNGNTLGTVVSNVILLHLFGGTTTQSSHKINNNIGAAQEIIHANNPHKINSQESIDTYNGYFNSLRILEDNYYQAMLRQELSNYVYNVRGDSTEALNTDLDFYVRYTWKRLNSDFYTINNHYGNDQLFHLITTYYPWNRTFEIGFIGSVGHSSTETHIKTDL